MGNFLTCLGRILLLALFSFQPVTACQCALIPPPCEAAWTADAVFIGTAYPLTIFGIPLTWNFDHVPVRFAVKEQFAGEPHRTIDVSTGLGGGDCGITFERGRDYFVYAHRLPSSGVLYTGICTRTAHVENAAEDLGYFHSLATNPPAPRIFGAIVASPKTPLAGVPVHLRSDMREWRTSTDASGVYEFPALAPGVYSLAADLARGFESGKPRKFLLHEHGCREVNLSVRAAPR